MALLTAGYQRESIDEFLEKLKLAGVEMVVDVRAKPVSRKPGFSKSRLQDHLADAAIDYSHMVDLGMPADLLARRSGDNSEILDEYRDRLSSHLEQLGLLADSATKRSVCLLCFEEDERHCHRSVVAEYVKAMSHNVEVVHLPPAAMMATADSTPR